MENKTITIFAPGSRVVIGPECDHVNATILEVSIGDNFSVKYEVVWWLSGRQTAWVSAHECREIPGTNTQAIGFQ